MLLANLKPSETGIIVKVRGRGAFRKRITEMGFIKGKEVKVVRKAPLQDPVEYQIMGYDISLRRSEAAMIDVITKEEAKLLINDNKDENEFKGTISEEILHKTAKTKQKSIHIALVGNPNCGKTTLFNHASGASEHVGNYSGVTVDAKAAKMKLGDYTFHIVDLPGTYSLSAYSPEELYVRKYIAENTPDIVINVVDASNFERNLYLTTQLIDMDIKVVMALNMYDELLKRGDKLDYESLGSMLGIPITPTVSSKGKGINDLFYKTIEVFEDAAPNQRHIHINYGKETENAINAIQQKIKIRENYWLTDRFSSRFLAIKLLEKDHDADTKLKKCTNYNDIIKTSKKWIKKLEEVFQDDTETIITDAKYGFINGAVRENFREGTFTRNKRTDTIDTFITHKVFGFPVFVFFIWIMFQFTFTIGEYPMIWIEELVALLSDIISENMSSGPLKALLINGIIGGVGGVIVFLPNILILFFFISLMEDTGYMARAAFIMDKLMHKIGLHGKSFIPLIMGFGCNVPAIMSTRTLENRNDRLLTMLINPFMSCSARLPVYLLIIGAFFPENAGTVLFSVYFTGIVMAILVALLLKKLIFRSESMPFVMELPPYRIPTLKTTSIHMWNKGKEYLKKMGGIILIASIIIWALGYYPQDIEYSNNYTHLIDSTQNHYKKRILNTDKSDTAKINRLKNKAENQIMNYKIEQISEQQENSYIGRIGQFIEPVIKPLGFDWKMGVSLVSGMAAKEIVVSTMGVLYQSDIDADESSETLKEVLKEQTYSSGERAGQKVFTPLVAFAFMIFVLIYFPCIAVIAAINRESGHWKWAVFTFTYTTLLAWLMSFLVYQTGSLLNL